MGSLRNIVKESLILPSAAVQALHMKPSDGILRSTDLEDFGTEMEPFACAGTRTNPERKNVAPV